LLRTFVVQFLDSSYPRSDLWSVFSPRAFGAPEHLVRRALFLPPYSSMTSSLAPTISWRPSVLSRVHPFAIFCRSYLPSRTALPASIRYCTKQFFPAVFRAISIRSQSRSADIFFPTPVFLCSHLRHPPIKDFPLRFLGPRSYDRRSPPAAHRAVLVWLTRFCPPVMMARCRKRFSSSRASFASLFVWRRCLTLLSSVSRRSAQLFLPYPLLFFHPLSTAASPLALKSTSISRPTDPLVCACSPVVASASSIPLSFSSWSGCY